MMETLQSVIVRLAVTAVSTAVLTVGAVYFVVDMSLQSLRMAIDITNKRIDDVIKVVEKAESNINQRTIERLDALEKQIRSEFQNTQSIIRRGSLDVVPHKFVQNPTVAGFSTLKLDSNNAIIRSSSQPVDASEFLKQKSPKEFYEYLNNTLKGNFDIINFVLIPTSDQQFMSNRKEFESAIRLSGQEISIDYISDAMVDCIASTQVVGAGDFYISTTNRAILFKNGGIGCFKSAR